MKRTPSDSPTERSDAPAVEDDISRRTSVLLLCCVALIFLLLRVPVVYFQSGGQDEDCYAIPGWTVTQTGLPQMPHVPSREQDSIFYNADQALFAEPPLNFYFQALFFLILPASYGTGRLASIAAGIGAICLVYVLIRQVGARRITGVLGAGLFAGSRWLLFPSLMARPDLLCALFGLLAISAMLQWQKSSQIRWFLLSGVSLGLGGLTHPFAIVYAVQLAGWLCLVSRGKFRLLNPLLLAAISLLVAALWFPLILCHLETFTVQFRNQFLYESQESLWDRILFPWESIAYHWTGPEGMLTHLGPYQSCLSFGGLLFVSFHSWRTKHQNWLTICLFSWTALFLLTVLIGPHHHIIGYWSYPAALMLMTLARSLELFACWVSRLSNRNQWLCRILTGALLILCYLPGSGLKTWFVAVSRWNDTDYHALRFSDKLISELPADAIFAVDRHYVFDFLIAKRNVILAQSTPLYFQMSRYKYDYVIIGRSGVDSPFLKELPVVLLRTQGQQDDIFACYAEVYQKNSIQSD